MKTWIVVLWLLSSTVQAAPSVSGGKLAPKSVTLLLNWKPEAEFGGFYEAETCGAYAKEGLKVTILPGGVGTPSSQMVAAGKAEFGVSSADAIVLSQDRGADVVALFAVYQKNPQGLLVREDRGVKEMKELFSSGVLAVQQGLPYFQFLQRKFQPVKAKIVPYLGGISQVTQDKNTAQQCFATSESILLDQKGIKGRTFLAAEAGFDPYTTVVTVRRAWAEKNRSTVEAFRRAILEGWKQYLKAPEATNKIMNALNPTMDFATLERSAEVQKAFIETPEAALKGIGYMSDARWTQVADQLKELGLVKKTFPAKHYVWE